MLVEHMNTIEKIVFFAFLLCMNAFIDTVASEKFILLTSLYHEKKEVRSDEYKKCLLKNIEHPLIEEVVVFFDTRNSGHVNNLLDFVQSSSVKIEYIEDRPSFRALFEYAHQRYPHRKIIVANADIHFNETLHKIEEFDLEDTFIALTRWNELSSGELKQLAEERSQDVWIFKAPFKNLNFPEFQLGTWQCDGQMSWVAYASGYNVVNLSNDIQACHVHSSDIRNYTVPRNGFAPGVNAHIVADMKVPIGGLRSFFQNVPTFTNTVFNICMQKYGKVKILVTKESEDIVGYISYMLMHKDIPYEIIYMDDNFDEASIVACLETSSVIFFDQIDSYMRLSNNANVIINWSGYVTNHLKTYRAYLVTLDKEG